MIVLLTILSVIVTYLLIGFGIGSFWAKRILLENDYGARSNASMTIWLNIFLWPVVLPWKLVDLAVQHQIDKNDQNLARERVREMAEKKRQLAIDIAKREEELGLIDSDESFKKRVDASYTYYEDIR